MEIHIITVNSITENLAHHKMTGCIKEDIETASLFVTLSYGATLE